MPFAISEKYQNIDWNNLNLSDSRSPNWHKGIEIIEDRFNSRFFKQIQQIIVDEFSGFLIMSIDCLLIETFMQFYLGVESTEKNYSRNNWKAFRDFFKQSSFFKTNFNTNNICKTFYDHFRCGLLHQAQTKQMSLIKICQPDILGFYDLTDISKGLTVDRKQFHERLELEFKDYLNKLSINANNFIGDNLREQAILKMNMICIK